MSTAQCGASPRRAPYTGPDLRRAVAIEDLRARAHRRVPRFALEYLEAGAQSESTLAREREVFSRWAFVPRTLVDVEGATLQAPLLGVPARMPLAVAPTGLNGVFTRGADVLLAQGAAARGLPFVQSTMSNASMADVAAVPGLRHWWQLYVFGGDEVWQELLRRAEACGCEALLLTTNAQEFGRRNWSDRTLRPDSRPDLASVLDAAAHPGWLLRTMSHGMPRFPNAEDFIPAGRRGFFDASQWIRQQMPRSLSWDTVARIRQRWKKPFLLKGLLHPDDLRRALDSGVDGVVLETHGGRQADCSVAPLDMLPEARDIVGDRLALLLAGGIRRGTDVLKALALGADAVMVGRAPLYGLCAAGSAGVARALEILELEALDAMMQTGMRTLDAVRRADLRALGAPA